MIGDYNILDVIYNGDFFCISPVNKMCVYHDIDKRPGDLPSAASDDILGDKVLERLAVAKRIKGKKVPKHIADESFYDKWVENTLKTYGYKSKKALFVKMQSCRITPHGKTLVFQPERHEELERWGYGTGDEKYAVTIPADSDSELIGKTLRLALKNCKKMRKKRKMREMREIFICSIPVWSQDLAPELVSPDGLLDK